MDPVTLHCTIFYGAAITTELDERGNTRFRERVFQDSHPQDTKPRGGPWLAQHHGKPILGTSHSPFLEDCTRGTRGEEPSRPAPLPPPPSLAQSVKP